MTTPDDPIDPAAEAAARDALGARADSVHPGEPDLAALEGAIALDRQRRRRRVAMVGTAAAALLLIGGIAVATNGSDSPSRVDTLDADGSTTTTDAPTTTAEPAPTTSDATSTTVPATTTTTAPSVTTSAPPATTTSVVAPPPLAGATLDAKSGGPSGPVPALMTDIRVGANDGFDRIVLEFADGAIPEYEVSYVSGPIIEDPTGDEVAVNGAAYLQIRMAGAEAHVFEGETPVATYPGPKRFSPGTSHVRELVNTGEFEAVYSWVIGVDSKTPFRVSTLSGPSRLVIDVAHG